jgi:CheY-like chemotaxis protein
LTFDARVKQVPLILLIENDDNDVFFFRRALSRCGFPGDVRVVQTAWQARNYLEGRGEFKDRDYYRVPGLIVCDLHLPGATGIEFVQWLREEPEFKNIPLIIWTGSMTSEALQTMVAAGASGYQIKTPNFQQLCAAVEEMLKNVEKPASPGPSANESRRAT